MLGNHTDNPLWLLQSGADRCESPQVSPLVHRLKAGKGQLF